jgi:hypothetical protein
MKPWVMSTKADCRQLQNNRRSRTNEQRNRTSIFQELPPDTSAGLRRIHPRTVKAFSPELVTLVSDTRGSFTYQGIDGFFEGMVAWSKHFFVNGLSRHEYIDETPTHVLVRMHGDLKLSEPINGESISKENDHDWTQEFGLFNDLITKVDIKLFFNQPA